MFPDQRFAAVLKQLQETHDKKQADYGNKGDPFANLRASSALGIEPWVGAILRANDKMARLQSFVSKGKLVNETVEDSLLDLAVYAIIAMVLYQEDTPKKETWRRWGREVTKEEFFE